MLSSNIESVLFSETMLQNIARRCRLRMLLTSDSSLTAARQRFAY